MTSIPPSLERAANIQGDDPNCAQYALAALRAEVQQLSTKALCTATATQAAERACVERMRDLAVTEAATTGAKRRACSLDMEAWCVEELIKEEEQEEVVQPSCIDQMREKARDVFGWILATVKEVGLKMDNIREELQAN